MEGYPAVNLSHAYNMQLALPLHAEAVQKASVGDFDGAEGLLWSIASIFHGGGGCITEDDPPYVREASERAIHTGGMYAPPVVYGKSRIPPRDPSAGLEWMVAAVDAAKAKWEEGAPARAAEWEKGAPLRKVAEEVARLKAEIARVEQEEVDRQAALAKEAALLAKEAALEKMRIQEEEEEKQRKAEVTSLERDAAALREKLAAMKELMALKAADPLSYAAVCASPSPTTSKLAVPSPEQIWADGCGPGVTRPSEADMRARQALRGGITGVSVSYAVVYLANKVGISQEVAEAVLAHLKPTEGHRPNALLAQKFFTQFAKKNGITVSGAVATMREWA